MKTVWKILPYWIKESSDGWGHVKGVIMYLPPNSSSNTTLIEHELIHLKQFYFMMLLKIFILVCGFLSSTPLIFWIAFSFVIAISLFEITSMYKLHREVAAYGRSVKIEVGNGQDLEKTLDKYASILSNLYKFDIDTNTARSRIKKAYRRGLIF